jgi:hypothetical protein
LVLLSLLLFLLLLLDSLVEVVLVAEEKSGDENQNLFRALREKTNEKQIARVEVELIGELEEINGHHFPSKYVIKTYQIGTPERSANSSYSIELVPVENLAIGKQENH